MVRYEKAGRLLAIQRRYTAGQVAFFALCEKHAADVLLEGKLDVVPLLGSTP